VTDRSPQELAHAGLAHDLKNQLGTMMVTIQLLQEAPDAPEVPELLGSLAEATRAARRLSLQLLAADNAPAAREFDLGEVACAACRLHQPALQQIGVPLHWAATPAPVRADVELTGRILHNLLENARAAPGVTTVHVRVAGRSVEVESPGAVMADETAAHLFEPLRGRDGGGLGLYLSLWLARRMGGDLKLQSRNPVTFRLLLPGRTDESEAK
jgi:signal transduction histidine kinase